MEKEDKKINTPSPDPQDFDMSHFSEDQENMLTSWSKKFGLLIFEIVKVVLISLAIILPIRLFLVQPFYVEGASMEPNFYENEYLIIDEISYRFNEPRRGEVVIFKSPQDNSSYFIKRVIGLPGEKVEIKDGYVFVEDNQLTEQYIDHFSADSYQSLELEEGQYYVMGDNRANSLDSRQLGPIGEERIIGRVWIRGWPIDRINTFNLPQYETKN